MEKREMEGEKQALDLLLKYDSSLPSRPLNLLLFDLVSFFSFLFFF